MKKKLLTVAGICSLLALLLLVLLINVMSLNSAYASENEWVLISDKVVNFEQETDTVEPIAFISQRAFSKIKIKCIQGTVNIKSMNVTMSDGSNKKLKTVGNLTKGMSTRAYTLPSSDTAKFDRLELEYKSWGNLTLNAAGVVKKAKIEVLGLKR
ncbi:hypothetical protein [Aliivibrio sifiae]|uniref:DUF2541 domain-containing protein n=1 Tax=Aliivibrio sifiae TaxID=566293 RepID=A0A2S7XB68_9GAMM|nr:hypothetical protein BTO22_01825 [Aliivibrio sifiae]